MIVQLDDYAGAVWKNGVAASAAPLWKVLGWEEVSRDTEAEPWVLMRWCGTGRPPMPPGHSVAHFPDIVRDQHPVQVQAASVLADYNARAEKWAKEQRAKARGGR